MQPRCKKNLLNFGNALAVVGLATLPACGGDPVVDGKVTVTISGEELAVSGYAFPPAAGQELFFNDGWEVRFTKSLAVVGDVTLSADPDLKPADASATGEAVARLEGPFVVDLTNIDPAKAVTGKGGGADRALKLGEITGQNLKDNAPFESDTRYAFGYATLAASDFPASAFVNVDPADADYALMKSKGYAVMYVGTATFKGDATGTTCTSQTPAYDFSKLPKVVNFTLGFATPSRYINCQNPDFSGAKPLEGEDFQRGVQLESSGETVAQVTVHLDHPFWSGLEEDAPLFFDQFALFAKKQADDSFLVTMDDLAGQSFAPFASAEGKLPWRTCTPSEYTPPQADRIFDTATVPYNPSASASEALRDYRDFAAFIQSSQGHFNADGLCYVERDYAAPNVQVEHSHSDGEEHDHD